MKLLASNAPRRIQCPGSHQLEMKYPVNEVSPSAREGTAAHWVMVQLLKGNNNLEVCAPNGEPITREMMEGADLIIESVNHLNFGHGNYDLKHHLHIEEPLDISGVHEDLVGTPDVWGVFDYHLHIWEYKYGHGFVDVFENWQLLEYVAGISDVAHFNKITMYIVQPRNYHKDGQVRQWTIDTEQLQEYIHILRRAETEAVSSSPACRPSPQCHHCTARHACVTLQQTALNSIDVSMDNTPWELTALSTGNELRYLLKAMNLLESRITGLSEQARSMITRGEFVPGFKLETSAGRERWMKEAEEIILMGELMGLDLSKPKDVITPVQARKIGFDPGLVEQYSQRIPGALKLVEDKNAQKVFGGK